MRKFRTILPRVYALSNSINSTSTASSIIQSYTSQTETISLLRYLSTSSVSSTSTQHPIDTTALPLATETLPDELELAVRSEVTDDEVNLHPISPSAAFRRTDAVSALSPGQCLSSSLSFLGQEWTLETGRLAKAADGSCTLRCGGTTVLATASWDPGSKVRRDSVSSREPVLDVDYREKLYAVGRIPGTYNKREGMPKEHEMLAARRVERALRPLLPRGLMVDTEVMANVLSADGGADPEVLAIVAASAALTCSTLPWGGPVGAVRVARCNGEFVVGPTPTQLDTADMQLLLVVGADDRLIMAEMEGIEVEEKALSEALKLGMSVAKEQIQPQLELARLTQRTTRSVQLAGADPAAARRVAEVVRGAVSDVLKDNDLDSISRNEALDALRSVLEGRMRAAGCWRAEFSRVPGSGCVAPSDLEHTLQAALNAEIRSLAIESGIRPDGRGCMDLRQLRFETDHIPVVHGSALIESGDTQALCTVTVGSKSEQQRIESLLGGEDSKRLFVHYSLPPYATPAGREGRAGLVMRTELDRSSLVERALLPTLTPTSNPKNFPFAVRLNVDALGVDGGSTMAAIGGGCLAMIDAGMSLRTHCAGVSIAILSEETWNGDSGEIGGWPVGQPPVGESSLNNTQNFELLTDPTALEVTVANAELRVAGTSTGVTACQLESRAGQGGIPFETVEAALQRALVARLRVLETMKSAIPERRHSHAPVFDTVHVPPTLVGKVIGREGATIKHIEAVTGVRVDVGNGGELALFAPSAEQFEQAKQALLAAVGENIKAGERYTATVVSIKEFGAFVSIPGTSVEPMLHISEVAPQRIRAVEDVVNVGDSFEVVCLGRDHRGTIRVSRKAALSEEERSAASDSSNRPRGQRDKNSKVHKE